MESQDMFHTLKWPCKSAILTGKCHYKPGFLLCESSLKLPTKKKVRKSWALGLYLNRMKSYLGKVTHPWDTGSVWIKQSNCKTHNLIKSSKINSQACTDSKEQHSRAGMSEEFLVQLVRRKNNSSKQCSIFYLLSSIKTKSKNKLN